MLVIRTSCANVAVKMGSVIFMFEIVAAFSLITSQVYDLVLLSLPMFS